MKKAPSVLAGGAFFVEKYMRIICNSLANEYINAFF